MVILTLRTDKPDAEIGLYDGENQLAYEVWQAHRALAETLHARIYDLLTAQQKGWGDIEGIVVFQGPGSFTGLRIGIAVANALASSLAIPLVAMQDPKWLEAGMHSLIEGKNDTVALPEYGAPVYTTQQKR